MLNFVILFLSFFLFNSCQASTDSDLAAVVKKYEKNKSLSVEDFGTHKYIVDPHSSSWIFVAEVNPLLISHQTNDSSSEKKENPKLNSPKKSATTISHAPQIQQLENSSTKTPSIVLKTKSSEPSRSLTASEKKEITTPPVTITAPVILEKKPSKTAKSIPEPISSKPQPATTKTKEIQSTSLITPVIQKKHSSIKKSPKDNEIFLSCSDGYNTFEEEFEDKFSKNKEAWLVLENEGSYNPYTERFSASNWIFWNNPIQTNTFGILGDCTNVHNWQHISRYLKAKISYIAADFNDLLFSQNRNDILIASAAVLKKGGIFCLEDQFIIKENKLANFSNEDISKLNQYFDIRYALYDGFIAALPYTSNLSKNIRNSLFKGTEKMILKLAAMSRDEFRNTGIKQSFESFKTLTPETIRYIISDIMYCELLTSNIGLYKTLISEQTNLKEQIEELTQKIETTTTDIENINKMSNAEKNKINKKGNVFQKLSRFVARKNQQNKQQLQHKLNEKQQILTDRNYQLSFLKNRLSYIETLLKETSQLILQYQDSIFMQFSFDKYLSTYMNHKRATVEEIIKDNQLIEDALANVLKDKKSGNILSTIEQLANSIRNTWSPNLIMQNTISTANLQKLVQITPEPSIKVVLILIKK